EHAIVSGGSAVRPGPRLRGGGCREAKPPDPAERFCNSRVRMRPPELRKCLLAGAFIRPPSPARARGPYKGSATREATRPEAVVDGLGACGDGRNDDEAEGPSAERPGPPGGKKRARRRARERRAERCRGRAKRCRRKSARSGARTPTRSGPST